MHTHKEGELYKVIVAYGKSFPLYYGYYEERDRQSPYAEPVEIYPKFKENPVYTDEGIPFVTEMQDVCPHFSGQRHADSICYDCAYYKKCEELLGICTCPQNRRKDDE